MSWSTSWKASKDPGKQRKYREVAPLHIKRKLCAVHLTKELRAKHNRRSVVPRTGDKAKILRGSYKGQSGKIEEINVTKEKIRIAGIEITKKDGNKIPRWFQPSNLMITEINLDDKKRAAIFERKKQAK